MVTLISEHVDNTCVGRCDARCYNAKGDVCDCICGGANHGKGLKQALENLAEALEATELRGGTRTAQMSLPGLLEQGAK